MIINIIIGIRLAYGDIFQVAPMNKNFATLVNDPMFWDQKTIYDFHSNRTELTKIQNELAQMTREKESYIFCAAQRAIPLPSAENMAIFINYY